MSTRRRDLLADDVFTRLHGLILSNVLGAGQKLIDRELAEQLGVSRTPIREALCRLAMTGLVETRAGRGWYVSQISLKQVTDLYEFRKILEVNAVKLATQNAQPTHLCEFESIQNDIENLIGDPTDHIKAVKLDWEIHELIARASGNESLQKAMHNLLDKLMCFIWVDDVTVSLEVLVKSHREHHSLIQMIKDKKAERATEIIHAHINVAQERLEKVFQARANLQNAVLTVTPTRKSL